MKINRRQAINFGLIPTFVGSGLVTLSSHTQAETNTMSSRVIEIVNFKLVKGANDAAFLSAAEAMKPFLLSRKGFVARRLSKGDNGVYTDHIEWATLEDATAAMEASMKQAELGAFIQMIDPNSMNMVHNALVVSIG